MILIVDNGSQYTHLIKRNCRDLGHDAEIVNNKAKYAEAVGSRTADVERAILSGGPSSVCTDDKGLSREVVERVAAGELAVPLLGICFGHQMIAHVLGAKVAKGGSAEYGISEIMVDEEDAIFQGVPPRFNAWVSHFDEVKGLPEGFVKLAHSDTCAVEAMAHRKKPIFGVQFHPEVWHTEYGEQMLRNFLGV